MPIQLLFSINWISKFVLPIFLNGNLEKTKDSQEEVAIRLQKLHKKFYAYCLWKNYVSEILRKWLWFIIKNIANNSKKKIKNTKYALSNFYNQKNNKHSTSINIEKEYVNSISNTNMRIGIYTIFKKLDDSYVNMNFREYIFNIKNVLTEKMIIITNETPKCTIVI